MAGSSLTWDLIVNSDKFGSGMAKAGAATQHLQKTMEGAKKESVLMSKAAGLIAGVGLAAALKSSISAASDFNETASKAQVVFRGNSAAVLDWSKTAATAMGMSQQQATEAAATFGNLFVALKIGQKPAADMSTKLVGLASDLASFNNVDPAEALDALRSGLVGETEPLRKFGVNMNDATLQAEAMKLGLIDHKQNALDPAIKAQAAYALILDQTKTAQGDFARTSGGLANSTRIFSAEIEDAKKNLGQAFLPAVTGGTHALNALLTVFNGLPGPIQTTAAVAGVLGAGMLILAPRIAMTKAALTELGVSGSAVAKGLGKAAIAVAALEAAGAAVNHFADASLNAGQGASELSGALLKLGNGGSVDKASLGFKVADGDVRSFNDALWLAADSHAWDQLGTSVAGFVGVDTTFQLAKNSIDQVDQALAGLVSSGHATEAYAAFQALGDSFAKQGGDVSKLKAMFPAYRDAVAGAASSTSDLASTSDTAAISLDALKKKVDALRGTQMSADEATANLEAAIDAVTESIKTNGRTLDSHTAKGRANGSALRDLAKTALDGVQAWAANGAAASVVTAKTKEARDAFVHAAEKMGLAEKAANRLADSYGLIPSKIVTTVVASTSTAQDRLDAIARTIAQLRTKVKIQVTASGPVAGTGGGKTIGNAAAVNKYGTGFMAAINSGAFSPVASGGGSGAAGGTTVVAPVNLYLDGNVVATSLLRVKRSRGGQPLGIS